MKNVNVCTAAGFIIYRLDHDKPEILGLVARHAFQIESNGIYDVPKGQRDNNEDPYQCALRECREESSLTPENVVAGPYKHGKLWLWLAECNQNPVINVNPHTGEKEHLDTVWLSPDNIIANCLDYLREPLIWAKEKIWILHSLK
jgi:8-oxo-dGTP pyrophosphatase MutT (NUDIX family)